MISISVLVDLITTHSSRIDEDVLLIDYKITDLSDSLAKISNLQKLELIENEIAESDLHERKTIQLELSIVALSKFGIYTSSQHFFNNYRYCLPENQVFLFESMCFIEKAVFYKNYKAFVSLIEVIESIAKYSYLKADDRYAFIGREDRYILIPLIYSMDDIKNTSVSKLEGLNQFLNVMRDDEIQEKREIYLNEFIDFLSVVEERTRFVTFVNTVGDFLSKARDAFSFYLSDFKFNKLKLEIDSKLLEFNQKIQGVINDSQNKLIAIPAAFVLGLTSFEYENIQSKKNIVILCALLVFTLLIQIFISNQKTALLFIKQNIKFYKDSFGDSLASSIKKRFEEVDKESKKQSTRLFFTNALLWFAFISSATFYLYELLNTVYPFFYCLFLF